MLAIASDMPCSRNRSSTAPIRAPHDGFVIYANNPDRQVYIEPGMSVRQRQQLFFLPDLTQMEVVAMIHESIVEQVSPVDAGPRAG